MNIEQKPSPTSRRPIVEHTQIRQLILWDKDWLKNILTGYSPVEFAQIKKIIKRDIEFIENKNTVNDLKEKKNLLKEKKLILRFKDQDNIRRLIKRKGWFLRVLEGYSKTDFCKAKNNINEIIYLVRKTNSKEFIEASNKIN